MINEVPPPSKTRAGVLRRPKIVASFRAASHSTVKKLLCIFELSSRQGANNPAYTNAMNIRQATRSDLPAIHRLVGELAEYEKASSEFTATLETYQTDFEAGIFQVLLAEQNEQILGMALYYMTYSTWKGRMLYLEDFVVQEAFRQQGVGQQLFEAFLQEARKMGCKLVKWQVLDWNLPAIKFYEKNKALIEKEWWNGKIFLT